MRVWRIRTFSSRGVGRAPSAARLVPVRGRKLSHAYYAIVFAVLALVAGLLGFVALSGTLAWIAKVLLLVFVVLFVLSLVFGRRRGPAV